MDVDAVLSSVAERDKWRRRLRLLEQTLGEVQARRRRGEARLKRLDRELRRLGQFSDALLDQAATAVAHRIDGSSNRTFPAR